MASSTAAFRGDLAAYVKQYAETQSLLIGGLVAPAATVPNRAGIYPKWEVGPAALGDAVAPERNTDGTYNVIRRQFKEESYSCKDRGLKELVDDAYAADFARFFDAETAASIATMTNVMLAHELRVASILFNNSNFNATAATVNYTGANLATINFAKDVTDAIAKLNSNGVNPNAIVMSDLVANRIKQTTLFQNYVKPFGVAGANLISNSVIAAAFEEFGINRVFVGKAASNVGSRKTKSMSKIWSNDYIAVLRIDDGALRRDDGMHGAVRTLTWTEDSPDLFTIESWYDDDARGEWVRVRQNTDEKILDSTACELITTNFS
jgi:hypothetical protein